MSTKKYWIVLNVKRLVACVFSTKTNAFNKVAQKRRKLTREGQRFYNQAGELCYTIQERQLDSIVESLGPHKTSDLRRI